MRLVVFNYALAVIFERKKRKETVGRIWSLKWMEVLSFRRACICLWQMPRDTTALEPS